MYPLNSEGYVIPCSAVIKIFPSLKDGIQLVAFLSNVERLENEFFILYNLENYVLYGLTENCWTELGVPSYLCYGQTKNNNELNVDLLIPDISNPDQFSRFQHPEGAPCYLDSTQIQQNFLIEDTEEQQPDDGEDALAAHKNAESEEESDDDGDK